MEKTKVYDLLIEDGMVLTMDAARTYYKKGYVAVDGHCIAEVGEGRPQCAAHRHIDASGCVVMPGFINTHTHMGMGYLRGFADDIALYDFLEKTFSVVIASEPQEVYDSIMLASAEMLRSGYTAVADMTGKLPMAVKAFSDCGMRCLLSPGGVDFNDESKVDGIIGDNVDAFEKFNATAEGRVKIGFTIHAPYDCSALLIRRTKEAADACGTDVHVHLAENREEVQEIRERFGMTPTEYLDSLGVLAPNVLAAHYVHVNARDMDIAKERGIRVSHNIGSNLKLASGISPVQELLKRGIPVGLGTDSSVTNNRLDAFDTMKTTALVHKGYSMDATQLPAYTVLEMATSMGARAIGMDAQIGSLAAGKCADVVLVRFAGKAHLTPYFPQNMENIISNLVYAAYAEDVDTVLVNGEILMQSGRIEKFDEASVIEAAQRSAERILRRSGKM